MKKFIFLFLCTLLMVCPVLAQDVCVRDSVFPEAGNCGYDVQDYQLEMTWAFEEDHWDVSEVITFISEWDTDELRFDFTDTYEITSLSIDGVEVPYDRKDTKLTVHYLFAHDTEYHLYAAFNGKLQWGELFDPNGDTRNPEDGFCMLNEPTNAWRFYICNDHPKDKATYHYSFTVPANYIPAGSGRLLMIKDADENIILPGKSYERQWVENDGDGTVTFTYAQETQTAPYLFTICAGQYDMKLRTLENGNVELDFVDRGHSDTEQAWKLMDKQTEVITALEKFFGPYPYEDLGGIVSRTYMGAALETQGRSLYDAATTKDFVFAHETTHQWFGDLISLEDWSDLWIKEGAATYGEALWAEYKDGPEGYEKSMKEYYEVIANGTNLTEMEIDEDILGIVVDNPQNYEGQTFDHEKAVKAIANLCQIDREQVQLADGDVTITEFGEGLTDSCDKIVYGSPTIKLVYEMLGMPLDVFTESRFVGPKEVVTGDVDVLYGRPVYYGGSLVYHSLRNRLGDEIFAEALQTLLEENKWRTVNTEKFIEVFNRVSGEDLTDFINSYLYYGEGHVPDLPGIETWEDARAKYNR